MEGTSMSVEELQTIDKELATKALEPFYPFIEEKDVNVGTPCNSIYTMWVNAMEDDNGVITIWTDILDHFYDGKSIVVTIILTKKKLHDILYSEN